MGLNTQWYGTTVEKNSQLFQSYNQWLTVFQYFFFTFFPITPILSELDSESQFRVLTWKQSFHPSSCSWLAPFRWIFCNISHHPPLPLLSFLWVNMDLTCSQTNPQIQFHWYHRGSPHMTFNAFFPQSKREFSTK